MRLGDYTTLSCLTSVADAHGWSEGDVPLERRGVSLEWLVAFLTNLQNESQLPRSRALQEADQAYHHNKAADYGTHDHPNMTEPPIPPPSLMNAHAFVKQFVKPLTADIQAPLYARIPSEHVGPPEIFISHPWNALLLGPDSAPDSGLHKQAIGTIDALARPSIPAPSYVWIDFICYNQHLFETIAPDMERVIGEIGRIGFAATPVPLMNRSWCLWEFLCSERAGASPAIFVCKGFRNDKILSSNAFFRSFAGVKGSLSSSPRDQASIFDSFLNQFGSFEAADENIDALIRKMMSDDWFELHERDTDLQFRPYPWIFDLGSDKAGPAAGIEEWRTFDPYYTPTLRESVLLGSHESVFDLLIDAGLHVSEADRTNYELTHAAPGLLKAFDAAKFGEAATLSQLLDAGLDVNAPLAGWRMLHFAANAGHANVVHLLLDRGADAEIATMTEARRTPLHMAALQGHDKVAAALLDAGAAVDPKADNDATPLHMAADRGHLGIVRLLVDHEAKIDAPNADGWTALFWASSSGHPEIVDYLLALGANAQVAKTKIQATPLHLAAANGHANVAALLLGAGVAVSAQASNGATPLHYALQNGHADVARVLLDHGADTRVVTGKGITLIELAHSSHMPEEILNRVR